MLLALLLQVLSRPTYSAIPPLTLTKESEIRGPEVQRPWVTAIWGSRLLLVPDDGPDADMVMLFDLKSGAYVGQLARRGAGPGEISMVRVARPLSNGELLTVDIGNARIARWAFGQTKPRKEEVILGTFWFDAVPWEGDTVLFSARGLPEQAVGYPLHLAINQRILKSFGTTTPHLDVDNWTEVVRRLTSPSQGCWWVIPYDRRYVIECYDSGRHLVRQIERHPPWFAGWPLHEPRQGSRIKNTCRVQSYTNVSAFEADMEGRVWVAFLTPSKSYSSKAPCAYAPLGRLGDYFDMPLEVLDGKSGELLASSTLSALVAGITTDGRVITYDEDGNDEPVITVWRARVPSDRRKGSFE